MASDIELKYKSWKETPVNVALEIRKIIKSEEELDEDKNVYIISLLSGLSVDEVMDLNLLDYERLCGEAMYVLQPIPKKPHGIRSLVIDGERYDVHCDFSKVTTAQYMDFTSFYRDPEKYYTNILTTFIIPHGKRYNDGYDAAELAKVFGEKLDICTAENASFFFASWSMNSMKIIQTLYIRTVKRLIRKEKNPEAKEKLKEILERFQSQKKLLDGLAI